MSGAMKVAEGCGSHSSLLKMQAKMAGFIGKTTNRAVRVDIRIFILKSGFNRSVSYGAGRQGGFSL